MVSIGSCDICGQFCASDIDDDFQTAEYHLRLAERLHDCLEGHLGPWHDRRGRPLRDCAWCAELTSFYGDDNSLDHSGCTRCDAERPMLPRRAPSGWSRRPGLRLEPRIPVPDGRGLRQEEAAQAVRHRLHVGLASTEPADRDRVEHALRSYLGQKHVRIEWYDSPSELGASFAAALQAGGIEAPLPDAELEPWSLWPMAPVALRERVADPYAPARPSSAVELIGEFSRRASAIADAVEDLAVADGAQVWPPFGASGQFDAVSRRQDFIDGMEDARPIPDGGFLSLMAELRESSGPVLFFDGVFHVLDRPLVLRLDEQTRLHCEDGPALAYPDGAEVWALHGVVVARDVVLYPERIEAADIERESNAEVRRVLVERFGAERLIHEGGAKLVGEDLTGKLWHWSPLRASGRHAEPVAMVEVINATAEPDGSFRTYFLRVPPDMQTAQEAVAWTFHLEADEYHPAQQT